MIDDSLVRAQIDFYKDLIRDIDTDHSVMKEFLQDLLHPEQYGHAVPQEVRQRAYRILNELRK